jgi:hypothetical protein
MSDEERRRQLYKGQLFVFSPNKSSLALCKVAHELAQEAFAPYHPREAHNHLPVEKYVEILSVLKPRFIHHPRCKELIRNLFLQMACDLGRTYFDVPRLRTMAPRDYLTAGLAYAFHPHRDTWFSAPPCQLNWWIPVYDIQPENTMAFHPRYWNQPVRNSSRDYNYYKCRRRRSRWNWTHSSASFVSQAASSSSPERTCTRRSRTLRAAHASASISALRTSTM